MKKIIFSAAMAATLLASCSKESNEMQNPASNQVIEVAINSNDALTTKAGRPLLSSEAKHEVDNVVVKIVDANGAKVREYSESNIADDATSVKFDIPTKEKLKKGTYTVYAYGYTNDATVPAAATSDFATSLATVTFTDDAEESFAGAGAATDITGEEKGTVKLTAEIYRQVAGCYGIYKNIPATITPEGGSAENVAKLRLVASAKNTKIDYKVLGSGLPGELANQDFNVVNGSKAAATESDVTFENSDAAYEVYTITLGDWFTEGDKNGDGLLNGDDTWKTAGNYAVQYDGAVYGGTFVTPFDNVDGKTTFELQALNAEGSILKTWSVKLTAGEATYDGDDVSSFSVLRNHLYTIGAKPTDDDSTPEDPQDLSSGQEIEVTINANWDYIHHMEIE